MPMHGDVLDAFARPIFASLAIGTVESALLVGALWLALRIVRTTSATTKHVLWWIVLGASATLPLAMIANSLAHVQRHVIAVPAVVVPKDSAESSSRPVLSGASDGSVTNGESANGEATRVATPRGSPLGDFDAQHSFVSRDVGSSQSRDARISANGDVNTRSATFSISPNSTTTFLATWSALVRIATLPHLAATAIAAWLGVALAGALGLARGLAALRRIKHAAIPLDDDFVRKLRRLRHATRAGRRAELRATHDVDVPVAVGFRSPAILLPTSVLENGEIADLDQIAMHEYAHLNRYDDWTNLAQHAIERIFWFNPAIAFAGRRISLEREISCDDWVIAQTGRAHRYATCLWKLVEASRLPARPSIAPGALNSPGAIATRIERLLDSRRNAVPHLSPGGAFALGAIAVALVVFQVNRSPVIAIEVAPVAAGSATVASPIRIATARIVTARVATPARVAAAMRNSARSAKRATQVAPTQPAAPAASASLAPLRPFKMPEHDSQAETVAFAPAPRVLVAVAPHLAPRSHRLVAAVPHPAPHPLVAALADPAMPAVAAPPAVPAAPSTAARAFIAQIATSESKRAQLDNCGGCDLSGADLHGIDAHGARVSGADLEHIDLHGANLRGASLSGSDLTGANLAGADLTGARFEGSNVDQADFTSAKLDDIRMDGTSFDGARFTSTNMRSLVEHCGGCDFAGVDLRGQDLHGLTLAGISLAKADLRGTNFHGARFEGVEFKGARIDGTDFTNAVFHGSDVVASCLRGAKIDGASFDSSVAELDQKSRARDLQRAADDMRIAQRVAREDAERAAEQMREDQRMAVENALQRMRDAAQAQRDARNARAPRVEIPKIEIPKIDIPKIDIPNFDTSALSALDVHTFGTGHRRIVIIDRDETGTNSSSPRTFVVPEIHIPAISIPAIVIPDRTIPAITIPPHTARDGTLVPARTIPERVIHGRTIPERTIPERTIPSKTIVLRAPSSLDTSHCRRLKTDDSRDPQIFLCP